MIPSRHQELKEHLPENQSQTHHLVMPAIVWQNVVPEPVRGLAE